MEEIQNPVLAVIDMQKGFVNQNSNHITPIVNGLIRECLNRSIPVIFTRFFNVTGSPYEKLLGWNGVNSVPDTDIIDELAEVAEIVVDKNFYTSLTDRFIEQIKKNYWKTIILCGVATESCVLKTAADAFEIGLRPIVLSDACASDACEEFHLAGLLVLKNLIGENQIMKVQELLVQLDK